MIGKTRLLQIKWIKVHAETKGDETADNQAKYNANCRHPSEEALKSYSKLKTSINEIVQKMWSKRWIDSENYRQTKWHFQENPCQQL